ncbi:Kinase [Hexamita inflata]|uniref:CAMK CAMKL n=1 Tax=Hexamita inflata TaxID=28002 RepID=A0AA86P7H1_9EUKA|nr:CAMK CAMKL [Hexamita inflata]
MPIQSIISNTCSRQNMLSERLYNIFTEQKSIIQIYSVLLKQFNYSQVTYLASGAYGHVVRAVNENGESVVIKGPYVKKSANFIKNLLNQRACLQKEFQIYKYLGQNNKNISVKLHELIITGPLCFLVLQDGGVPLHQWVKQTNPSKQVLLQLQSKLIEDVKALNSLDLHHCDIKSNNILVDNLCPRLIDFGMSQKSDSLLKQNSIHQNINLVGPAYIYPTPDNILFQDQAALILTFDFIINKAPITNEFQKAAQLINVFQNTIVEQANENGPNKFFKKQIHGVESEWGKMGFTGVEPVTAVAQELRKIFK